MCLLQPSPRSANLAREEQARSAFPRWTESKFPDEQSKGELPPPLTHVLTTICRGGSMKFWDITTPLDQPMRILATVFLHKIKELCKLFNVLDRSGTYGSNK
jgi:hypothetical protein